MKRVLVTGAAGFIGYHLSMRLLEEGLEVTGADNLNPYYEVGLKEVRLDRLKGKPGFSFVRVDIADREGMARLFGEGRFDAVVHLAAQAGVRYSIENPESYVQSNLVGFFRVLEGCRAAGSLHLVFASSSSVYGANTRQPFSVGHNADHPLSLYAATKKADELMAHAYSSLHGLPCTGLRFFTVYGPWGRPDMAYFKFARQIVERTPIEVYNYGRMKRDFTYVDDVVEGVWRLLGRPPQGDPSWDGASPDPGSSFAPYRVYNIGNNRPIDLLAFIGLIERELGLTAEKRLLPMQEGDVPETCADISDLEREIGFRPVTEVGEGVVRFVRWFREYYRV